MWALRMPYDHLVLACGSAANLHVVPGMADYAFPLKKHCRRHCPAALTSWRRWKRLRSAQTLNFGRLHLTFHVVGGGYSGVKVAGEINELVRSSTRYFKNFRSEDVTVMLITPANTLA